VKFTQARLSTVLNAAASIAATLLPVLVDQHVITAAAAFTIGSVLTSILAGWHGNTAISNRQAKTQP
jgi:hypothetical protein